MFFDREYMIKCQCIGNVASLQCFATQIQVRDIRDLVLTSHLGYSWGIIEQRSLSFLTGNNKFTNCTYLQL